MKRNRLDTKHESILISRRDAAKLVGMSLKTIERVQLEDGKLTPIKIRSGRNSKVYYRRDEVLALVK